METCQLNEKVLEAALCEVRKAHRLIYEYQRRMQDLTWFIRNTLGFNSYLGFKKFSDPIGSGKRIYVENWSWDWIYTYVYEYHLGYNRDGKVRGSLIQVTDTGFYDQEKANAIILDTYKTPEESRSLLVFYFLISEDKQLLESEWKPIEEKFSLKQESVINPTNKCHEIVYPVPLHRFLNEKSTIETLKKIVEFCKEKTGVEITNL